MVGPLKKCEFPSLKKVDLKKCVIFLFSEKMAESEAASVKEESENVVVKRQEDWENVDVKMEFIEFDDPCVITEGWSGGEPAFSSAEALKKSGEFFQIKMFNLNKKKIIKK